jgi:hypothetical protein
MQERIPSGGYAQFGFTIFAKYLEQIGVSLSLIMTYLISVMIFTITLSVVFLLFRVFRLSENSKVLTHDKFYLVMATVFLSCFMTGISYDPRLIYLTLAGFSVLRNMVKGFSRTALAILLFIASCLSCGIELGFIPQEQAQFHPLRVVQLLNDVAIEIIAAILVIQLTQWLIRLFTRKFDYV